MPSILAEHSLFDGFSGYLQTDAYSGYNDVVRAVAAETGATLVDLARQLPKDPDYFYDDDHFTIAGARAVADVVREALLEAGWPELPR